MGTILISRVRIKNFWKEVRSEKRGGSRTEETVEKRGVKDGRDSKSCNWEVVKRKLGKEKMG